MKNKFENGYEQNSNSYALCNKYKGNIFLENLCGKNAIKPGSTMDAGFIFWRRANKINQMDTKTI